MGVDSAQQILPEVGATAATFPSDKQLSSWVGACPGDEESAGVSKSHRSPKGNRHMRRVLNQCANAAVRVKGSVPRSGCSPPRTTHRNQSNHGDCPWLRADLDDFAQGVRYEETGPGRARKVEASTHCQNDPAAPKPRLPVETADCSNQYQHEAEGDLSTLLMCSCGSLSPEFRRPGCNPT